MITVSKRGKNVVGENGIITSKRSLILKRCEGSFYKEFMRAVQKKIKRQGDWVWIKNFDSGDVILASDVENYTKRFAAVFANLGVKYGDGVHILTGNNNFTFISMYSAFYLGAFASTGDISLDADTIAGQLNDIKKVKLVICVPNTAMKAQEAVKLSKFSDVNNTVVVCLGESEGCTNIYEILKTVSMKDAPDPVDVNDVNKEYLLIFWSSGTTGAPKGICFSNQGMWNCIQGYSQLTLPRILMGNKILKTISTQSMFHSGSFWAYTSDLLKGVEHHYVSVDAINSSTCAEIYVE